MVSDATGETAQRLVQALEAQFPDQEFSEIRHPRVESIADLQLAVDRMKGRPAVVVYTLVEAELREAMRALCRRAKLHYCDLLGHPIDAIAKVSGQAAKMKPRARPPLNDAYFRRMSAIEFAVKYDDGVGSGLADVEDAALYLPRLPRLQDRERPARQGHRPAARALLDRPDEARRADDRR